MFIKLVIEIHQNINNYVEKKGQEGSKKYV